MKKLLVLTCCVGLVSLAGAAQQNDQNDNQKKKKGGNAQPQQQVVTPQTGKKYKTGQGGATHNPNFQQPSTATHLNTGKKSKGQMNQGNVSGAANTTKFNKSNTVNVNKNKNVTVNKNYKVQKFNLQTNKVVTKYKTVNYNASYHIAGAAHWGPRYAVFVNYHPAWHDAWWWNWHYGTNLVFIYGGWYYWNANYWYPAWGYAPDSAYYFDGPIYASNPTYDPAQVVANVQTALNEAKDANGNPYYQGDIDGILGPQTRAALAQYQSDQGLEPTGLVDEPTLQTLGMV